jgi:predicted nicotinamide N-methyase
MGIRIYNNLVFIILLVWYIQSITELADSYNVPTQQQTRRHTLTIQNGLLSVHRVPLRYNDDNSPYAFAVTTTTTTENDDNHDSTPSSYNFLATQVWPSSRTASIVIENYFKQLPPINKSTRCNKPFVLCEFGCGPGLPSLTALKCNNDIHVIATDIEPIALELVRYASMEQNVSNRLQTQIFNVIMHDSTSVTVHATATTIPVADIYILSDIFESGRIAKGAAQLTIRILKENPYCCIWVFAQSDRAQREIYLQEIQNILQIVPELKWCDSLQPPDLLLYHDVENCDTNINNTNNMDAANHHLTNRLWLCNIDEGNVFYG